MSIPRRTLLGSSLVIAGLIGLAALVVVAVIATSADEPEPEVTAPEPDPEPEPVEPEETEPEPPAPVEGEVELLGVRDLSIAGRNVVRRGSSADAGVDIDQGEVEGLVSDLAAWLDEHLTQLQNGDDGLVRPAALTGDEEVGDLAGPADPVDDASYTFVVGARGEPEWAEVTVRVRLEDGERRRARMVFDPDRELIAVERRDG